MKALVVRTRGWWVWLLGLPYRHRLAIPIILALVAFALDALARPGGGQSYSGGGSSRSGGSSSSGSSSSGSSGGSSSSGDGGILAELVRILIWMLIQILFDLTLKYPKVMLPIWGALILAGVIMVYGSRWLEALGWSSDHGPGNVEHLDTWRWMSSWDRDGELKLSIPHERIIKQGPSGAEQELRKQLADDKQFSTLLFADFVQGLYAAVHIARGKQQLANLAPYLSPEARTTLDALTPGLSEVRGVVVGSQSFEPTTMGHEGFVLAQLRIQACYTEVRGEEASTSYFTDESWIFSRKVGVKTKAHEGVQSFGCPNCGGPLDHAYDGKCRYCSQVVENGDFDWVVTRVIVRERTQRQDLLSGTVEEVGTDHHTILDPSVEEKWRELQGRDPAVTEEALARRIALVFDTLQTAWSNQDLSKARAFLSDATHESMRYWIEMYKAMGHRNVTEHAKLRRLELVRVRREGPHDAVTVRVFASSVDYTVRDSDGRLISGSKTDRRRYTEYWTFLRARSARGAPRSDLNCPNCGAPLDVSMAGECTHCQVRVVSGQFDWVLSRIEQDEAYRT